ncbi:MAG: glutamate--tRNA ligase [Nanoarchaeota archaeon]|nr:glutamate--tRNA ligase [Nanoarchaeota archaeon]
MEISKDKIKAYALKNALHYKGKANPGAVVSALFNEGLEKDKVKEVMPEIQKVIKEISKLNLEEQEKEFEKLKDLTSEREVREGLPELPNAENGVVMRFAPSPSGAMHIGHAITGSISYDYVKKYGGKFIVRVEDTNPGNIYAPAIDLLKKDAEWLFENKAEFIIQSDRMDLYYGYAVALIEKEKSYVCTCEAEEFRKFAKEKKECPCRNKDLKENLKDWERMLGTKKPLFKEGEAVLRFKSDMNHKNPAMRDFPLARISLEEHPRQGKKYRVWPLMNLSVSVDDIEMGMTHIIRAKEHRDNAERQKMIYEVFGKTYPWAFYLGRIHLKGLRLSASQMTKDIKEGKYSGWDDPELPTVQSLKNKGYKPEAFWKMAEHIGLSEVDKTLDKKEFFLLLDNFNKNLNK